MSIDRKLYKWFYDNIACHYYDVMIKWCFLPFGGERKVRKELLDTIALGEGNRILDMCCGTGSVTLEIAENAGEKVNIVGIDLSLGQVRVARKRNKYPNIAFAVNDATNTSFKEDRFDTVVIPHAIHEMPRSLRLGVLAEARRVLRPEGRLAVLEMDNPPNVFWRLVIGFSWFYWLPFNFETPTRRDMLKHGVATELEEVGFNNVGKLSLLHGAFQVVQGTK